MLRRSNVKNMNRTSEPGDYTRLASIRTLRTKPCGKNQIWLPLGVRPAMILVEARGIEPLSENLFI